jgi:hypothetical protein
MTNDSIRVEIRNLTKDDYENLTISMVQAFSN